MCVPNSVKPARRHTWEPLTAASEISEPPLPLECKPTLKLSFAWGIKGLPFDKQTRERPSWEDFWKDIFF